jgi:hypothetical protein
MLILVYNEGDIEVIGNVNITIGLNFRRVRLNFKNQSCGNKLTGQEFENRKNNIIFKIFDRAKCIRN